MTAAERIEHWSAAWVGTPYGDRGRGPDAYDCWGLVQTVFAVQYGIALPSYADDYPASVAGEAIEAVIDRECRAWHAVVEKVGNEPIPATARQRAREGDVVVLRVLGRRMHCGVALDGDRFVHVLFGSQGCVERMSDRLWERRVEGIYRHRAMT